MLKGLVLALFLLASPANAKSVAEHKNAKVKQMHGRKVARSLHKDLHRLQELSDHAQARGHAAVKYEHPAGKKLDTSDTGVTEVSATYGVVSVYDFVVDVGITDTSGDIVEIPCIMDTGSSNLAVAIEECTNCEAGSTDLEIDLASPTYCLEVEYGSGSWLGELAGDDVEISLGDLSGTASHALTGITYQDDFFDGGYSGIFGLSYAALAGDYYSCSSSSATSSTSSSHGPGARLSKKNGSVGRGRNQESSDIAGQTLLGMWKDSGVVSNNKFAITYCTDTATLSVGEVDATKVDGDLTYITTQKTFDEYYGYFLVKVTDITFDASEVDLSESNINEYGGVLIDSGTTLMYLPSEVVKAMKAVLESSYSLTEDFFNWDTCLTDDEASDLPDLTITFEGDDGTTYTMTLSYQRYLYNYGGCLYWGVGASSFSIIGNIAQEALTIVFDLDNNEMAFADAVCTSDDSSTSLFESLVSGSNSVVGVSLVGGLLALVTVFVVVRRRRQTHSYTPVATKDEFII